MKNKWEMLDVIKLMISICIIILALLQLLGIIEQAINYLIPLFGINLLILYIQDRKTNKTNAIISICVAIITFAFSFYIWFV